MDDQNTVEWDRARSTAEQYRAHPSDVGNLARAFIECDAVRVKMRAVIEPVVQGYVSGDVLDKLLGPK